MSKYSDLIQATAERMLALMQQGTIPWRQPWNDRDAPPNGLINGPWNPTTGKQYRGSNTLILRGAQLVNGYEDSRWLTYKQALAVGGQVRRGEVGQQIAYWDFSKTGKAQEGQQSSMEGEEKGYQGPSVFVATVFNGSQVSNLAPPPPPFVMPQTIRNLRVRELLDQHQPKIHHDGGNRAFYSVVVDSIHMPKHAEFNDDVSYQATLLHELAHWTGAKHRLDRDQSGRFGSEDYAKEELVAELSSLFISERLGIGLGKEHEEQHAAYLQSWMKALADDPKTLFRAASQAEKVMTFLDIPAFEREPLPVVRKEQEAEKPASTPVAESSGKRKEREAAFS
ncbi:MULTISPECIES: zincin-like metallopeptidase domain-containing protein [Xanthomonas]|uniref:Zincin-like metallopeptidase domain-containing protein n=1 Tax=Xanthomonas dyei TaxID=743699 RepID=A0ABZ0DBQ7_9XANT|nr:zincin-like metallopeptidase domain-containing protein [Xanthomonas dyei]WOB27720.1 zincin-like metallopeptidase domain-containing protein [Xanthomonas dyei]WOB55342.1 zincin-like metallopeptidase domain-containing protein [Xanthomonas dyei]